MQANLKKAAATKKTKAKKAIAKRPKIQHHAAVKAVPAPKKKAAQKILQPKKRVRPVVAAKKPKAPVRSAVVRTQKVLRAAPGKKAPVKPVPGKAPYSSSLVSSLVQGPPSGPKYFFSTDIPDRYNETYMRALPRDPLWIFAYWEISQGTIDSLKSSLGDAFVSARWVLRVSDVTDIEYNGTNAWRGTDIEIPFNTNNWYIKVWEPARVYLVQGGLRAQDRVFFEAVRSNAIQMPRAGVSAITDEEWSTAASDELLRMSAGSLKRSIGASERMEEAELGAGLEFGLAQGSGSGAIL